MVQWCKLSSMILVWTSRNVRTRKVYATAWLVLRGVVCVGVGGGALRAVRWGERRGRGECARLDIVRSVEMPALESGRRLARDRLLHWPRRHAQPGTHWWKSPIQCTVSMLVHAGALNKLLSWSTWVPLSRLTYCVYLIHSFFIQHYNFKLEFPIVPSLHNMMCTLHCELSRTHHNFHANFLTFLIGIGGSCVRYYRWHFWGPM